MSINPHLLNQARGQVKQAFMAAGDPAMAGGDPAAMGGAPQDPAMAGGDPAAMGGAPPMDPAMDPAMGGAPPQDPMAAMQPMIDQAVQAAMAAQGGGGGTGPAIKPKIDVNVELMQIKKLLARIADAMGVQIPAAEMVATPDDLNQMAEGGTGAPAAADGGAAGGGLGSIEPIKAAEAWEAGVAFSPPSEYDFQNAHQAASNNASLATSLLMRNRKA
jgi:hypothetical protein